MKRVYIAGPYTQPDVAVNVRLALVAADELMTHGFFPYVPHLSHFQHMACPRPYEEWLRLDLHWLEQCEAVLRLPGVSPGADQEVARALELGIPVFYSVEAVWEYFAPLREATFAALCHAPT